MLAALGDNTATLAPRTNVVLMGQGEPLLTLRRGNGRAGDGCFSIPPLWAWRRWHVTLSTQRDRSGDRATGARKSATESGDLAQCLEQRATRRTNAHQSKISTPFEKLMEACRTYPLRDREYLTFEYVLLGGGTDAYR